MIKKRRSRKAAPMTKERKKIQKKIERTYDKLRNKYPEIRGKVPDGIVYVGIHFTDKTVFSLRYGATWMPKPATMHTQRLPFGACGRISLCIRHSIL